MLWRARIKAAAEGRSNKFPAPSFREEPDYADNPDYALALAALPAGAQSLHTAPSSAGAECNLSALSFYRPPAPTTMALPVYDCAQA